MSQAPTVRVACETILSRRASTRATLYTMSHKIVTHAGKTHVGWLDHLASCKVATRDVATGEWTEPVWLADGIDNHCGPALTIDSGGLLHVMCGSHGTIDLDPPVPFQYRRSLAPNDASLWTAPRMVGVRPTYPSLVGDRDDNLWLAYRGRAAAPTWMWNYPTPALMLQKLPAGGKEWLDPVEVVRPLEPRGYAFWGNSLCVDSQNRLHLAFSFYTQTDGVVRSPAVGYACWNDDETGWTTADGTETSPPFGVATCDVVASAADRIHRVSNVVCDGEDRPHMVVWTGSVTAAGGAGTARAGVAYLYRHDGEAWRSRDLTDEVQRAHPGGMASHDSSIAFDADGCLYVALQTAPEGGEWGGDGSQVVLLFSADGAETFQSLRVSDSDDQPNWQPSLERPASYHQALPGVPALLYTHGPRGEGLASAHVTEARFVQLAKE